MRYYLYISDTKVDMLFPQVPGAVQQAVARKVGFDLKLLSASIETQNQTFNSRIARLQAVEEHLRELDEIGAPMDRTPWIGGTIAARAISLFDNAVLFFASMGSDFLVLGGSADHIIGNSMPATPRTSSSSLYYISRVLRKLNHDEMTTTGEIELHSDENPAISNLPTLVRTLKYFAGQQMSDPTQQVEFLAKRLSTVENERYPGKITIATPLYVALAE